MKIRTNTTLLLDGLGHANHVAASKSPKPVLECVALHADKTTGVRLEATDLDVGLRLHLEDAVVEQEGSVIVPAARLLAVAREVDDDETSLSAQDGVLSIETGGSKFEIRGEAREEFPVLSGFPDEVDFQIDAAMLQGMARRTVFACAKDPGRFAMHGVQVTVQGTKICLVATDGRRLARSEAELDAECSKSLETLVGPKTLSLLDRIQGDGTPRKVDVATTDRQLHLRFGKAHLVSRVIEGTFPVTDSVIPKDPPSRMKARVADLAAGLRRASLLTTRDALSVEFVLDPDVLVVKSRAVEVGRAEVQIPVQFDGEPLRIGFNPDYFQEGLRVMDPAAEVELGLSDAKSPARLSDDPSYVYVLSPIALE